MRHSRNFTPDPKVTASKEQSAEPQTWVVTDGNVGMEAQGLAIAQAIGLPFAMHQIRVGRLVGLLPVPGQLVVPPRQLLAATRTEPAFSKAWPRLVISVGRRSVPVALAVKRASGGKTYALHIQDPQVPLKLFDLIAAPMHDQISGDNVIETFGAVHSVEPERLEQAAKDFAEQLDPLPQPRIAVILGGKSRAFDFPVETAKRFGQALAALARETGGALLISASRRTPEDAFAALKAEVAGLPGFVWDGTGDNPYFAFLAAADAIVVTGDSVNMLTEAAGTGKPVLVQPLPGNSARLSRFHEKMRQAGITRPFSGKLETWSYEPVNDTRKVASIVRKALGL